MGCYNKNAEHFYCGGSGLGGSEVRLGLRPSWWGLLFCLGDLSVNF